MILVVLILTITSSTVALGAIKLELGHEMPAGTHQYHQAALYFADLIKEKTNGAYEIEVFPSGLLGGGALQLEACRMGTLGFSIGSTSFMASYVPNAELSNCIEEFSKIIEKIAGNLRDCSFFNYVFNFNDFGGHNSFFVVMVTQTNDRIRS